MFVYCILYNKIYLIDINKSLYIKYIYPTFIHIFLCFCSFCVCRPICEKQTKTLQLIPQVTSVPYYTTLLPLVFVLLVSGAKDAWDDFVSLCHPWGLVVFSYSRGSVYIYIIFKKAN